jgi:AbrB family looped-hinge helix DNA binding protein
MRAIIRLPAELRSHGALVFLTNVPYNLAMKATLTSKGQITIPIKIREKLGLKPGQVLDFDEDAPYLKATPVFDEDAMRSVVGCAEGKLGFTAAEWLDETRGPAERKK